MTNIFILLLILVSMSLTLFLINWFVRFKLKSKLSESENPITINIFKGILFISGGLLLTQLIVTFQTTYKILERSYSGTDLVLRAISFYSILFAIVLVAFAMLLWLSTLLFNLLQNRDNIFVEIANNNLKSLILFIGILFALTIAVKTGITPLLDGFIPYPTLPIYR